MKLNWKEQNANQSVREDGSQWDINDFFIIIFVAKFRVNSFFFLFFHTKQVNEAQITKRVNTVVLKKTNEVVNQV